MDKKSRENEQKSEITVTGIPASPGIAIGNVFLYSEPTFAPELRIVSVKRSVHEVSRFKRAIQASRSYLEGIYKETVKTYGKEASEILETQIAILDDKVFLDEVEQLIREKHFDAAYATFKVFRSKKEYFLNLSDEYFKDRAFDVQTLKRLILKNLLGKKLEVKLTPGSIVVADNLSPSDTIRLHHKHILGFSTNVGGKNSHTVIIARSLGVPAVVSTQYLTNVVKPKDQVVLDGNDGIVIVNPAPATIRTYQKRHKEFSIIEEGFLRKADQPSETTDGLRIRVAANIEFVEELEQVSTVGAEGIGLYRTEGLFLSENGLPTEEDQYDKYLKIARAIQPHNVVIRTLDVGGDKLLPEVVVSPERNPFLGWRAIRFCFDHEEIFLPQLKAILRSNIYENVHILIPMVSSIDEIHIFKNILQKAEKILKSEKKEYNSKLKIGMMVEIPSAAILSEYFASEVDFFSIGTNDLIQYTLAVDRANEKIARLYNHFHPALLKLIIKVIEVGKATDISVNMCGEMAGDPVAVPLLIGMGLENFSASHFIIPEIKEVVRNLSAQECRKLYKSVKNLHIAKDIQNKCENFYGLNFVKKIKSLNHSLNIEDNNR